MAPATSCPPTFQSLRNMASSCDAEVSKMQKEDKKTCLHLLEVAECLASRQCSLTGSYKCSATDFMMTFRNNSEATRDWLGLQNATQACDGMSAPHSMCEDVSAAFCFLEKCASGSLEEFFKLDEPAKCNYLFSMRPCLQTMMMNAGQSCKMEEVVFIMTQVSIKSLGFDPKQCPIGGNTTAPTTPSTVDYCSDVRNFRNFEQNCSDEITAIQKSPDCNELLKVTKCLSIAMCNNGTHLCGNDEIMVALRNDEDFTKNWLGLENSKEKCDGMVLSGVCEDADILTCQLMSCSPGTPEQFAALPSDQKCSSWGSITSCTLSALSAKGKKCNEDGVRKVTGDIALKGVGLDVTKCPK
ncbi:uncharacterized protein LOC124253539 [Haliotis rubra]|uniref:uncharacterized protein LOC124253539 n=1 Tax=Haliotis rubra TaxID=36100 RepID=UPI001EE5E9E1|nr:uncharacterized protein LOC124253539 [Haliotis rubra]